MITNKNVLGAIAVAKVTADLLSKGYLVFTPQIECGSPVDAICYAPQDGKDLTRLQIKYDSRGCVSRGMVWTDSQATHIHNYKSDDFDFFAIYLPDVDTVIYPSIKFAGVKIATTPRASATPFYWYKDFLDFTNDAKKHSYKEFGVVLTSSTARKGIRRPDQQKVDRPTPEVLQKLLWEQPTTHIAKQLGISDNAVARWVKQDKLTKPPRGYWAKLAAGKLP